MSKAILIIGAGVSGLAFAQGLSKHGIPFEVYDRDISLTARAQGYRFRISDDGVNALRHNLIDERFEKFEQSACSDHLISNARGTILHPETAEPADLPPHLAGRSRPEAPSVDRTALRCVLMEGIEQHVHFGKAFESYHETEAGVTVRFADKSEVTGIALVGADGTWSRVRQQLLPDHRLVDTEGRLIFGKTDISEELLAKLLPESAKGPTMLLGRDRKCLMEPMYFSKHAQDGPKDYVYWALFCRSDEDILDSNAHSLSPDDAIALAKKITKDWHPSLRCLVDDANRGQTALYSVISTRPTVNMSDHASSRVTLLGDASHPMSPTAALGASTALRDTDMLVQLLRKQGLTNVTAGFHMYEREMCTYANEAVKSSAEGGRIFFGMREFDDLPVL